MLVTPSSSVFVHPQVGEHLFYPERYEAYEDGVAGILGRCRQDGGVKLLLHVEEFRHERLHHPPLVETEIVYQHDKHLLAPVKHREDAPLEDLGGS